MSISENVKKIYEKIEKIPKKNVENADIIVIAVSKTVGVPEIDQAIDAGLLNFGENKVQEIEKKFDRVKSPVDWHLIGSLQTNKVKNIIDRVALIHSLDRISLAEEIDRRSAAKNITTKCLVQVNISLEDSKHGLLKEEVPDFIKQVSEKFPDIEIMGLMGMAPFEVEPEDTRIYFRAMKELFDNISSQAIERVSMKYLSMGMSNDYLVALEEGSNMIRIGTSIFGERNYD